MTRIRAITFDLDDTLYDNRLVLRRAEETLQTWLERHYPRLTARHSPDSLRELRARLARAEPALQHDLTALRRRALAVAAREAGYGTDLADAALSVFLELRNRVALYVDVRPTLVRLGRHYTLGAITNGNADVTRLGLGGLFDFALSAADVGASKPDPAIFRAALTRLGAAPGAVVHVGDDAEADVGGARAAGLRAVWVNREGRDWPGGRPPDLEVRALSDVPAALDRLEAGG